LTDLCLIPCLLDEGRRQRRRTWPRGTRQRPGRRPLPPPDPGQPRQIRRTPPFTPPRPPGRWPRP